MKRGLRRGVAARARESQLISIDPDDSSQWPPRRRGAWRHGAAATTYASWPLIRRDAPDRRRDIAVDSRSKESTERERTSNNVAPAGPRVISPSLHPSLPLSFAHSFNPVFRPSLLSSASAIDRPPRSRSTAISRSRVYTESSLMRADDQRECIATGHHSSTTRPSAAEPQRRYVIVPSFHAAEETGARAHGRPRVRECE